MTSVNRPIKVLVVEDSAGDVVLLKHMLKKESFPNEQYIFTDVARLIDAFNLLDKQTFDLVLLDLNLLDIDGVSSVSALHAQKPNIPIIVYSGLDDIKVKEKALLLGAKNYLVKGHESSYALNFMIHQTVEDMPTAA